jgi:hypothetical protein
MVKNSDNFPNFDMQQAKILAQSDAARQLFALLQSGDPTALQSAMALAAAGDMTGAKKILDHMMASPQAQSLLQKLQGDQHG